ncbi:PIG-L deacetylase family protein [Bacillus sp. SM2101]|uniref:PIG-L deacetylase family protein n=1 Tax=Bacillus sp. SM2101 TaxID=2805366 RepID=UPI001BDEFFC3|nr:PIG-L deacetylase family protein [Bacillus sp. SM2101]
MLKKTVLIIASHPDDELLGSGATIKKLINGGYEVITVITAQGRNKEDEYITNCCIEANKELGVKEVIFLEYPNLEMETFPLHLINKKIEKLITIYQPCKIFTHHYGDLNKDHQVTFQAVMTAARPIAGSAPIDIICFETVSSTEWTHHTNDQTFKPNYYVDVTDTIDNKLNALKHYDVEMRLFPHPRSFDGIKFLARYRGMTVGVHYAEAFEIIRRIQHEDNW